MKSYQIVDWGKPLQAVLAERPTPTGTEVLLKVDACGVCHSDVHIRDGYFDLGDGKRAVLADLGLKLPFTLGHEIAGTVVEAGPDAHVPSGRRFAVFPWIGCGACVRCLGGEEVNCETPRPIGTRRHGGFSEYVVVPHERYLVDYGDLDPNVAAVSACSGLTAYSALRKLTAASADDVLVIFGAGGVGLTAVNLARHLIASKIVVVDINDERLSAALEMGADAVINSVNDPNLDALKQISSRKPLNVVDFVGASATLKAATSIIGKGGCIVVVGLFGGTLPLSTALLPMRQMTLRGSYVGTIDEMRELIELLKTGRIAPIPMTTMPMSEVSGALDALKNGTAKGRLVATP
ncbi:alcohol dehydrogenase [Pararobbsia silviterrae]|uniref:Alcohol dehydrogenase n=1 Tax=Pararobbsia silviterrae TaxID=1792498 RepID=A0A494Y207_9BURK|nr:alcohol dehydrogenase [Pararobbsia silviterrae]RKP56782.1 alcohol dehydrogenase [Pararobbsia silviterrae]